jgi:hypothetical protein
LRLLFAASACLALSWLNSRAQDLEMLRRSFERPPASCRPWVYWVFMDGNLSREGITADLEAMRRVGIGGVIIMEVDVGIPRGPVGFMSEQWRGMFKHAVGEAERLGLEIALISGPGWTGSGGPWVRPEQSMQHLVGASLDVTGPTNLNVVLPRPGPRARHFVHGPLPEPLEAEKNAFYKDEALLAFPTPGKERIADVDEKALYYRNPYSSSPGVKPWLPAPAQFPVEASNAAIRCDHILDLAGRLSGDGQLSWDVPEGQWTILRLGRASTGANTRPAPSPGLGLECDKFDPAALDAHFESFFGTLLRDLGPRPLPRTNGWTMLHIDSWEMGAQNWTARFREQFRRRRGYDPLPFLPAFTGRIVESREISERFLWDVRQTAQELVIENHARHLKSLGRRHGFGLSIEPYDMNPCADLSLGGVADVPMGEFWADGYGFNTSFSCLEAASIAHTTGRTIIAAESFTSDHNEAWRLFPAAMKNQADWAFCCGINRLVFHRYAHQPWLDRRPGMTMGPYGVHYERTQTWWELAGAWHQYLARCQFLLRQGSPVADICFLAAEGAPHVFRPPLSALRGSAVMPDHQGYNFDGCAPETLFSASVHKGQLVLPGGASYRLLVLPEVETMTPKLLRTVKKLVQAGATVVGMPPIKSPSLTGYPGCDDEVRRLSAELWGAPDSARRVVERAVGKGRVIRMGHPADGPAAALAPEELPGAARWIWHPEGRPAESAPVGSRVFRRTVQIDFSKPIASAHFLATADNSCDLTINGKKAGSGSSFKETSRFDVKPLLRAGKNLITIAASNVGETPNPAGLIGALIVQFSDKTTLVVGTDSQWESAQTDNGPWQTVLDLGPQGMPPWGELASTKDSSPAPSLYGEYDTVANVLDRAGVPPDFESDQPLRYIHRRLEPADIYYVSNPESRFLSAECVFRCSAKTAEIWDPVSGSVWSARPRSASRGRTRVTLDLSPNGSAFVMLRRQTAKVGQGSPSTPLPVNCTSPPVAGAMGTSLPYQSVGGKESLSGYRAESLRTALEITGPWELEFQAGSGAPERITLERLQDWATHADPRVKFFGGIGVYRTTFEVSGDLIRGAKPAFLDLGEVQVIARVTLNRRDLGILWTPPFRADITSAVKAGRNDLQIEVANLWPNRLIGDRSLPEAQRLASTTWNPFTKDSPLLKSGLLGPVTIQSR